MNKALACFLLLVALTGCRHKRSLVVLESASGDFGQQLTDAINACAPGACWIDARQVTGYVSSAQSIVISRSSVTIEVGFSQLSFGPGANLQITGGHVALVGPPTATPTILCGNGVACVYIGGTTTTYATTLANLRIEPEAGTSPSAGIEMRNAKGPGSFLRNLVVTGFTGGAALRLLENNWTWTAIDSQFSNSNRGVEILGDQDNAWIFQRNLFTSNVHEGVWIALCNHPTSYAGCTTGGMTFSDGNHFESNGAAGIRLVSGSIYNMDIRDSYAELRLPGTGYVLAQNHGTPNQQLRITGLLVSGGGGYVEGGVALNIFDATEGYLYGTAPIPVAAVSCVDGTCTVTTTTPHGFSCSTIDNFMLCPFIHLKSGNNVYDLDTKITAIVDSTHFTFFLNGTSSDSGGTVEYAPDGINAIVTNQKWRTSWTAPAMVSATGTEISVVNSDNSVMDGEGYLISGPQREVQPLSLREAGRRSALSNRGHGLGRGDQH
jgi:hypothetical protein